jgi:hypothetical protein
MPNPDLLEKLVLAEVGGKNRAIHAYDRMMWTVRTGFLTLFSAGWGLFLKALLEAPRALDHRILLTMMLLSLALGIGGLVVDRSYARRKFRVIHALDLLIVALVRSGGRLGEDREQLAVSLQVSGDEGNTSYEEVSGYAAEEAASRTIFLLPMAVACLAVFLLWT